MEGLADRILRGKVQTGTTMAEGIHAMRAMIAIARSVDSGERIYLNEVTGTL